VKDGFRRFSTQIHLDLIVWLKDPLAGLLVSPHLFKNKYMRR